MTTTYDIRRCWAHNLTGDRCDLDSAHDGAHSLTVSWDDDECWDMAGTIMVPVLNVPYLDEQPKEADSQPQGSRTAPIRYCVVCEHPWHETDGCDGRGPAGMSCDCRTSV